MMVKYSCDLKLLQDSSLAQTFSKSLSLVSNSWPTGSYEGPPLNTMIHVLSKVTVLTLWHCGPKFLTLMCFPKYILHKAFKVNIIIFCDFRCLIQMYFQIWKDSNKIKASQGRGIARDCGFELISIPKVTV